jgi:hypothetical protein
MKLSKTFIVILLISLMCAIHTRFGSRSRLGDAKSYVQFARLPYCGAARLLNPACEVCNTIRFLGYSVEKVFTYERTINGRPVTITMTFSKNFDQRELVVSFGGPKTEDIQYIQSLYSSGFVSVNQSKIEKGFWDIYEATIRHDLIGRLDDGNYFELVFVGHSVGGSFAVLAAYDVAAIKLKFPNPHVFVYGALTVGDETFMIHFKKLADVVRIKKNHDFYMQFPTCLITGINHGTCFEDYSTLLYRYPKFESYLSVAYPLYHGLWPSPFYTSYYGGIPYYGFYHPGGLYGSLYDYPSRPGSDYPRDTRDPRDQRDPSLIDDPTDKDKVPNDDKEPLEEPIPSLKNKKADPRLQSVENIAKIQQNLKSLKSYLDGDKKEENIDEEKKHKSNRLEAINRGSDEEDINYVRENNRQKENYEASNNRINRRNSYREEAEDIEDRRDSSHGETSNYRDSSYESYNHGSNGNRARKNYTRRNYSGSNVSSYSSPSYESGSYGSSSSNYGNSSSDYGGSSVATNFLETRRSRRSKNKNRMSYRKAFLGYFDALENCRIEGKSANCKLDPNVHKTYYGVDIENCF